MSTLSSLLDLLCLDRMPRTGWIVRGVAEPESVAGHLLGTGLVALALAPRVEPPLELERVLAMAILHDAPEALTGDLPKVAASLLPPGAKARMESGAAEHLLGPLSPLAQASYEEYVEARTREARFVRLCDKLQLGVRLLGYHREGRRGLDEFRASLAELDCAEFAPAEELRRELLAGLDGSPGG